MIIPHLQKNLSEWENIAQSYHRLRKSGEELPPIEDYALQFMKIKINLERK